MGRVINLHPVRSLVVRSEIAKRPSQRRTRIHSGVPSARLGRTECDGPRLADTRHSSEGCAVIRRVEEPFVGGDPDVACGREVADDLDGGGGGAERARGGSESLRVFE
jgi:hypothetical protein